jgi:hypothetical protein
VAGLGLALLITGYLGAQKPSGWQQPSGTAETSRVDLIAAAAKQIVDKQKADAADTTLPQPARDKSKKESEASEKALDAWKLARKENRFCLFEQTNGSKIFQAGVTTPDTPSDPKTSGLPIQEGGTSGTYVSGQTGNQFTGLDREMVMVACVCLSACVLLHEGYRLEQDVPPEESPLSPNPTPAQLADRVKHTKNNQQLANFDLANIKAARATCAAGNAECLDMLKGLEDSARASLKAANLNAAALRRSGQDCPDAPPAYPPQ